MLWGRAIGRSVRILVSAGFVALGMLALGGCAGGDGPEDPALSYMKGSSLGAQPFPANYRADILAFMRTYLNDPRGIRNAALAPPAEYTIAGRTRYIACVRYTARNQGDRADGEDERAIVFLDGRLDRIIPKAREICTGAPFAPFPELEKLTR